MTITEIEITNFKCFEEVAIKCAPLTLLTGYNGAGKSSALQPLLLMAQALREPSWSNSLPLNGNLVRLGSAGDIINDRGGSSFSFCFSTATERASWDFDHQRNDHGRTLRMQERPGGGTEIVKSLRFLTYVSAIRKGDLETFPYPDSQTIAVGDVGSQGEFAPYWYIDQADEEIHPDRRHPTESRLTIRGQIDAWFSDLFEGASVNAEAVKGVPAAKLTFQIGGRSGWRRQANVGFGLSYVFPILVALTCSKPGQTIVIDSPEAHLHPSAQSMLGQILAHFASSGLQVIIESHSDHVLSGVRLAVKKKILEEKDTAVHFFAGSANDQKTVNPTLVEIKQDGSVENWPSGFFDQSLKDLVELS